MSSKFFMPAEWHPHDATWMSWPNPKGISFPGAYEKVLPTFGKMIDIISQCETLRLNVSNLEMETLAKKYISPSSLKNVEFYTIPTNEPWCRDHGPIFLIDSNSRKKRILDWDFNAWGGKYKPWTFDDSVPSKIAEIFTIESEKPGMVLEGGSIEVNGEGILLTTESCLLNKNRNPKLSKSEIEANLKKYLNVHTVVWLGDGIEGDDTDGHIDDLSRFINANTVVTAVEENPEEANYIPLQENLKNLEKHFEVVKLPMPKKIVREDTVLPASYANFYIASDLVLVPTFEDKNDERAISILKECFPTRKIIGLSSSELIWGLGSFHCLTQQEPRA